MAKEAGEDSEEETEEPEEELLEFFCVACNKNFKSEKQ